MKKLFPVVLCCALALLINCKKEAKKTDIVENPQPFNIGIEVLAKNLEIPWSMLYLPNGDLLFTERKGRINLLKKGESIHRTIMERQVKNNSEGGLLSICLDPNFSVNRSVYIYETTSSNRVIRLKFENDNLTEDKVIVDGIPLAGNHDGGALKFGPDGYLYIGTGDAQEPSTAQDKNSLAGKILRVDRDGNDAPGNPFNTKIWSYGHRNVQGITWTTMGRMIATEHGPSGEFGWCCHDEVNLIEKGNNYGWPLALGGTETGTLTPPLVHSGDDTWAPSGCLYLGTNAIWPNCLLVATLRGQRLIRFRLNSAENGIASTSDTLHETYNRLRSLAEAPDGSLLFGSSNIGSTTPLPLPEDDKIYRIFKK